MTAGSAIREGFRVTPGFLLQAIPVTLTLGAGIVAYFVTISNLQYRVDILEKAQPTQQIAVELTNMRDRTDTNEKDITKLEAKEASDYADLRQQIWRRNGSNGGSPPP